MILRLAVGRFPARCPDIPVGDHPAFGMAIASMCVLNGPVCKLDYSAVRPPIPHSPELDSTLCIVHSLYLARTRGRIWGSFESNRPEVSCCAAK